MPIFNVGLASAPPPASTKGFSGYKPEPSNYPYASPGPQPSMDEIDAIMMTKLKAMEWLLFTLPVIRAASEIPGARRHGRLGRDRLLLVMRRRTT